MSYFKDQQGDLHYLSDQDIANGGEMYLPRGCTPITDAQADAIQNPPMTLAQAQAAQIAQLTADCAAQIVAGFTSSALGSAYAYPSQSIDQQNMVQTAASSAGGSLMCAKAGTWALTAHTQAQAQQVLKDFIAARDTPREKLQTLIGEVNTATIATVSTIVW